MYVTIMGISIINNKVSILWQLKLNPRTRTQLRHKLNPNPEDLQSKTTQNP